MLQNICNNDDFIVQTASETCVQCVRHSFCSTTTADDISIHWCCDQWHQHASRCGWI